MPLFEIAREECKHGTFLYHVHDGLHYHQLATHQGSTYYKCVLAGRGCRGRATYDAVGGFVHTAPHNHQPDIFYPEEMALRRDILRRCASLDLTPFRQIVIEEGNRYRPEVAARVVYVRMRASMLNARLSYSTHEV